MGHSIDMEKVINGLQCIIDGTVRCESCGYAIDKHGHHSCQQNCVSDAIALLKEQEDLGAELTNAVDLIHKKNDRIKELLKEQEAVPVIQREVMHMLVWCCGSCGVAITVGDKFCRMCGRRMKWE